MYTFLLFKPESSTPPRSFVSRHSGSERWWLGGAHLQRRPGPRTASRTAAARVGLSEDAKTPSDETSCSGCLFETRLQHLENAGFFSSKDLCSLAARGIFNHFVLFSQELRRRTRGSRGRSQRVHKRGGWNVGWWKALPDRI